VITYRPYFKRKTSKPSLIANPHVFFIFPTALFLIQFYASPQTAHLALPCLQTDTSAKPKEPFMPTLYEKDKC
jgi:hypothetical protein